jgi:hypothetical protein
MQHARRPNRHFNLDLTLARAEGPLAVALGPIFAVYGLHLVEAAPAIYVIHPVGVARLYKVVARPGEYVVVAFAGDDLIVAAGAGKDLRQGFSCAAKKGGAPTITTITMGKMYSRFI